MEGGLAGERVGCTGHSDALCLLFRGAHARTGSQGTEATHINLAAARLTRFARRRVVFLVTQPGVPLGNAILAEALLPGISVYHVGGDPWKQEVAAGSFDAGSSFISSTSSNEAVSSVAGGSGAPVFQRVRDRETEDKTFASATRDALRDGYGYYDLTVNLPADVTRLELGVNVWMPGTAYSIYAQPYVKEGRPRS
jgi:hypothetical protein